MKKGTNMMVETDNHASQIRSTPKLGVVTLSDGVYVQDGNWFRAAYGWLKIVTDAEWGEGFRSSEKWSLFVYCDAAGETLKAIIPGCGVRAVVFGACPQSSVVFFDATQE